jgi:ribonuclease P/MRP protein subunit POP5
MVRIKHRYLLFNILYPDTTPQHSKAPSPPYLAFHPPSPAHVTAGLILTALRASIALHFGDVGVGLASSSLKIVYFSPATSTAIVRCPRQHFRVVWAALTYLTELPGNRREEGKKCVVQVVRVSGTIRKSEEELLRRNKRDIVRVREWEEKTEGGDGVLARLIGAAQGGSGQVQAVQIDGDVLDEDDMSE